MNVTAHTPHWQDRGVSTSHLIHHKVRQLSLSIIFKKLLALYLSEAQEERRQVSMSYVDQTQVCNLIKAHCSLQSAVLFKNMFLIYAEIFMLLRRSEDVVLQK